MTTIKSKDSSQQSEELPLRLALRPKDAAYALGISERLLWEKTKNGDIPHVRINRAVIYPVEILRDFLAENVMRSSFSTTSLV